MYVVLYSRSIGGQVQNDVFNSIGRFKFSSMVWYCLMYMHALEVLVNFTLVVEQHTAKFLAIQYVL